MNPEFPQNERAKMETKLTALLLGELHADEVASLSKAMEADLELAALYERLKVTIELVREAKPAAQEQALKLSAEKREKLLASFKTVVPEEFAKPRRVMDWLVPAAAVAAIVMILAALMLPALSRAKYKGQSSSAGRAYREPQLAQSGESVAPGMAQSDQLPSGQFVAGQIDPVRTPASQNQSGPIAVYSTSVANRGLGGGTPQEQPPAAPIVVPRPAATPASTREQQHSFALMPNDSAPTAATPTIVLPTQQSGDVVAQSGKADGFNLNVVHMDNADSESTKRALERFQGAQTNALALNTVWGAEVPKDARQVMDLGTFKPETTTPGVVAMTNGLAANDSWNWTIDTHNKVGALTLAGGSIAQVDAEGLKKAMAEGQSVEPGLKLKQSYDRVVSETLSDLGGGQTNYLFADSAQRASEKVPVLGDLPMLGQTFKGDSSVAANPGVQPAKGGEFAFELGKVRTDFDTSAIAATNGIAGHALAWGSYDGTSNPPIVFSSGKLASANTYGGSIVANNDTLDLGVTTNAITGLQLEDAATTNSSAFAARYAYVTPPPASDNLLTSGLRTPARGGEVAQEQNQNSILTARANQALSENATAFGGGGGGGFGGGGGQGFRGGGNNEPTLTTRSPQANGGKQVELAAAANVRASLGADQSRLQTATVKVAPDVLYNGVQNVGAIYFGATTNSSVASAAPTDSGRGRGLRYITGLDAGVEKQIAVSNFLQAAGVNIDPAKGKSVFFNDRQGTLTVRGTEEDLALVQQAIDTLSTPAPQVVVGAKFAEVNTNDSKKLGFDWYFENYQKTNGAVVASTGSVPGVQTSRAVSNKVYSAGLVGYVDVSTNVGNLSLSGGKAAEYASAKEELERAKSWREALKMKTLQEQTDVNLPKGRMVTILAAATPASTEKRTLGEKIKETFTGEVGRTASIQVEQERSDVNVNGAQSVNSTYDPYFLLTEFQTIQSDAVLGRVVKQLNLDGGDPSKTKAAEEKLKKNLDLRPVKNSKVIEIGAKSEKPEDAARIANAVAEAYRDYRTQEYQELKHGGILSLQQQLQDQDQRIAALQTHVDDLQKSLSGVEPTTGAPIVAAPQTDAALPKPSVPPPTPQLEILTRENAFSTFSLNVSEVSFKLAAATLEKGQMPEPGSIRTEEFINAFDYRDPEAAPGVPVAFASERARYPFAHNRELLRFSLKTAAAGRQAGRPLNIVLLLDNSGSMERADRVGIIREALHVLAGQLQAGDTFSIVTFARTAQLRVDGIPGNQAGAAADEIAKLTPEGGTNLGEALELAYETARHHYLANGDNRVVLLTDGAANLGDVNAETLKQKVEAQRQQGIALDCFGIGWEGYNDDLLEVLTRNGDGRYGFINSPAEADTEFVAQIAGALHVAASDVKVQVEFNPQRVTSYRQIGYAKHQLTKEQFRDNTVDAAEIAAQEAGNALYTIEINPEGSGSIATVRVRYKMPGTAEYREQAWDVPYTSGAVAMDQATPAMRLASTACAFSEWLATSPFAAEVSTDELLRDMSGVPQFYGADGRPAKLEWMIRQAKSISGK